MLRSCRRPARELVRALVDVVLPPACPACGEPADALCGPCGRNLERRADPGCGRCGEPVVAPDVPCSSEHRELRNVAKLVAPFRYAGTGGQLVRRFKLDGDAAAGLWLVRAMAASWSSSSEGPWRRAVLVSVPLHRRRRRLRGFDQARWLARGLGERLGLGCLDGLLIRPRETLPQGDPRVTSRAANVEGAFTLVRPARIAGRRVVLVDDVFTSGATVRACASLLRAAGAPEVAVLVACRS